MSTSTHPTQKPTPSLFSRQQAWLLALILVAILAVLLVLAPAERQLGNLVKVIYVHGALARSGILGLIAAGVVGVLFLIRPRPPLLRWSNAIQVASMAAFVAHFVISVIPTHQTWGVWVAFDEPRTIMSLQIIGAGLAIMLARSLIGDDRLSALANLLLAAAVALLAIRTGVLRHPLNPIGDSNSLAIKLYYVGIVVVNMALTALLAWVLASRTRDEVVR